MSFFAIHASPLLTQEEGTNSTRHFQLNLHFQQKKGDKVHLKLLPNGTPFPAFDLHAFLSEGTLHAA